MKTGIIYCPNHRPFTSPAKRWAKIEAVLREQGVEYDLVQSESADSVERLVNMLISNGYDRIIIAGGDSALNDAVNCLMKCEKQVRDNISLGIIPNGVMNDFANYWGFTYDDLETSVASVAANRTRKVDVGSIRYRNKKGEDTCRYFINCVNIGLLAAIQRLRQQTRRKFWSRKLSFMLSLLLMFFQKMIFKVQYTIDSVTEQHRIMTLCVGNAQGYGQTPNGTPYNGLLDVTVVRHLSIIPLINGIYLFLRGRILMFKNVLPYRTRSISFALPTETPCSIDGHPIAPLNGEVTINVEEEEINFIIEK